MNARDELIQIIWNDAVADRVKAGKDQRTVPVVRPKVEAMADKIIAAGYRKPRVVTTLEELKTVYEGAILKDAEGEMWGIDGSTGRLFLVGDGNYDLYDDDDLHLPATVVYEEPEAAE